MIDWNLGFFLLRENKKISAMLQHRLKRHLARYILFDFYPTIIIIIKMVETVEELMIAVLGGSADIVSWPHKVVLCAAEVSIYLQG